MKPPFELPVKIFKCSVQESLSQEVYGIEDSILIIAQGMTKEQADYIVAAINSHEKFKTALEKIADDDSYEPCTPIAKQALKEVEKPK